MKILFVTHYGDMLGANRSMLHLIIELRKYGEECTVLLPYAPHGSELSLELKKREIPFAMGKYRCIKHHSLWKVIPNYLYSLYIQRNVLKALHGQTFDIIHSNSSVINVGKYIAKKLKAKHIWHLREFGDIDYNLRTPFGKWYQKFLYKGKSSFIAISKKILYHYSPYISPDRVHLIYNGVHVPQQKASATSKLVQFCIVGILHENKGQLEILKAMNELINNRKVQNFHLTIVGSGNEIFTNCLVSYAQDHNLSQYVTFTGYQKDVENILSHMDVGIMASTNEAFGRVTIEYMMSGLAVIASDGGANEEIVNNRSTGLLYHVGDYYELADRMEELINNRKLMKQIADKGTEYAEQNFSSSLNAKKILTLYNQLCSNKL